MLERINKYKKLRNDVVNKKYCQENLLEKLKLLGKGGSGCSYSDTITIGNNSEGFAIKSMSIYDPSIVAKKNILNTKYSRWREVKMLILCNDLLQKFATQNLPFFYGFTICHRENSLLLFSELFEGTFKEWMKYDRTNSEWISFYLQLLLTLLIFKKSYILHNDLTMNNILFIKSDETKNKYWKYTINNKEYYVKNNGYIFIIWDFGSSFKLNFNVTYSKKNDIMELIADNKDWSYFIELDKRIKMFLIINRYSIDELEKYFIDETAKKYLEDEKKKIDNVMAKYQNKERFWVKLHKNMGFYIIENNKFDELYNGKKTYASEADELKLMPENIIDILKTCYSKDLGDCLDIFYDMSDKPIDISKVSIINSFNYKH